MRTSAYTKTAMHPARTGALVLASGALVALLWRSRRNHRGTAHALSNGAKQLARGSRKLTREMKRDLPRVARQMQRTVERNLPLR